MNSLVKRNDTIYAWISDSNTIKDDSLSASNVLMSIRERDYRQ